MKVAIDVRLDAMPRTVFYERYLEAVRNNPRYVEDPAEADLIVPLEDTACESNWPFYGDAARAYVRGSENDFYEALNDHIALLEEVAARVLYPRGAARGVLDSVRARGEAHFSYRLLEVMSFGCVPVVLSDGWVLPFDRLIEWDTCALIVTADAIPDLPDVLRALEREDLLRMRAKAREIYATWFVTLDAQVEGVLRSAERLIEAGG
jgi:hypothetical protein